MKITFLVILCAIFGLLSIAHAAPKQKRDLSTMKDLIREIKAESNSARAQSDKNEREEEVIAQLFLKVLEEQAKAERYEDSDKLAQTDSIFSKIRNWFRKVKTKFHNFGRKVRRFFGRKGWSKPQISQQNYPSCLMNL